MIDFPIVTAFTASALMVLQIGLMMAVGFKRLETNIGIGVAEHEGLHLAVRRHGNLAENAPLFLILLGLAELSAGGSSAVLGLGAAFVAVRISHAVGLSLGTGPNAARAIGAFGTVLCSLGATGFLIYNLVSAS